MGIEDVESLPDYIREKKGSNLATKIESLSSDELTRYETDLTDAEKINFYEMHAKIDSNVLPTMDVEASDSGKVKNWIESTKKYITEYGSLNRDIFGREKKVDPKNFLESSYVSLLHDMLRYENFTSPKDYPKSFDKDAYNKLLKQRDSIWALGQEKGADGVKLLSKDRTRELFMEAKKEMSKHVSYKDRMKVLEDFHDKKQKELGMLNLKKLKLKNLKNQKLKENNFHCLKEKNLNLKNLKNQRKKNYRGLMELQKKN